MIVTQLTMNHYENKCGEKGSQENDSIHTTRFLQQTIGEKNGMVQSNTEGLLRVFFSVN